MRLDTIVLNLLWIIPVLYGTWKLKCFILKKYDEQIPKPKISKPKQLVSYQVCRTPDGDRIDEEKL